MAKHHFRMSHQEGQAFVHKHIIVLLVYFGCIHQLINTLAVDIDVRSMY